MLTPNCRIVRHHNQINQGAHDYFILHHNWPIYTGIGSRQTPESVIEVITKFAIYAAKQGWLCRSGGAGGADKAFAAGHRKGLFTGFDIPESVDTFSLEEYLPWKKFNGNNSKLFLPSLGHYYSNSSVGAFHPASNQLTRGAFACMERNFMQVVGTHLLHSFGIQFGVPSKFVLAYAPGGLVGGGTSQALRIANAYGVPIFNLYNTSGSDESSGQIIITDEEFAWSVIQEIERQFFWDPCGVPGDRTQKPLGIDPVSLNRVRLNQSRDGKGLEGWKYDNVFGFGPAERQGG